jgi:RHS repeat-associated protein
LEVIYSTEATTRTVYFLKDHLGSVRATVLDSAGAPVIGYDDYDPWGYPLAQRTKAIPNAYLQGASKNKFTGKEYDDEYGVNWLHFPYRSYDPEIGRWMVKDPLEMKYPSWSPYVYTFNNPFRFVDPDGLRPWPTNIHNRILREAFGKRLTDRQIGILEKASRDVDRDQSAGGSFKHGMRDAKQSVDEAKAAWDQYIETKKKEFIQLEGDEALYALGEALHAITDATSPTHEGFQVWEGLDNPKDWLKGALHALQERKISDEKLKEIAEIVQRFYDELLQQKREQEEQDAKNKKDNGN